MFFLNSASSAAAWFSTCLVCVHTLTPRENRKGQSSEYFKKNRKKTQYLMNTLYLAKICSLLLSGVIFAYSLLVRLDRSLGRRVSCLVRLDMSLLICLGMSLISLTFLLILTIFFV